MRYYAFAFKPLMYLPIVREAFVHRIVLTVEKQLPDAKGRQLPGKKARERELTML